MSPMDFAERWSEANKTNLGLTSYMIVADINSNSMVYISKNTAKETHVLREVVGFGVHTLSSSGLDSQVSEDKQMKSTFGKMMYHYESKKLQTLKQMAEKFKYYQVKADKWSASGSVDELKTRLQELYDTNITKVLVAEPTNEVKLYESYLENENWKDHAFNID